MLPYITTYYHIFLSPKNLLQPKFQWKSWRRDQQTKALPVGPGRPEDVLFGTITAEQNAGHTSVSSSSIVQTASQFFSSEGFQGNSERHNY